MEAANCYFSSRACAQIHTHTNTHKAQPAFAEVATEILRLVISTTGGPEHERARDDMLQLPSLVLLGKQGPRLAIPALIQRALADGPVAFQPLSGTGAAQLDGYWEWMSRHS